jgi:catechol 2,3-dioxygenase-like lactoylglutathione lyase family enzyme
MTRPAIDRIAPSFLVRNAAAAVAFYRDQLGFEVIFQEPAEDPFFAIVCRDGAMILVKAVGVDPVANRTRHPWGGWDAYVSVPDPDALAAEFASRGVVFSEPL